VRGAVFTTSVFMFSSVSEHVSETFTQASDSAWRRVVRRDDDGALTILSLYVRVARAGASL